jgi:hypothetical protein
VNKLFQVQEFAEAAGVTVRACTEPYSHRRVWAFIGQAAAARK